MRQTWHGKVGQSSAVCMGEAAVGGCRGLGQPRGYGHSRMGSPRGTLCLPGGGSAEILLVILYFPLTRVVPESLPTSDEFVLL